LFGNIQGSTKMNKSLVIDQELKDLIPSLAETEKAQLRENIQAEGCRDPLIVWAEENTIIDGHNRYEICSELGIDYEIANMSFGDRDAVVLWMINNQLGRRNLTREDFNMLVGRKYNRLKKAQGGDRKSEDVQKSNYQSDTLISTAETVAKEHGIGPATVYRVAKVAAQVDAIKAEAKAVGEPITDKQALDIVKKPHVSHNSGDNEWYTPEPYIEAARSVMGKIDMDPASHETANETVCAETYYTEENNGLEQDWKGRLWMNPPYAGNLIGGFCEKMAASVESGDVTEAHILVNNATETRWFARLCGVASCICLPTGRIKFWHPRKVSVPLQGQCVIYIGDNVAAFCEQFAEFGIVCEIRK
jgi:phage N-6-adenine-methyltransferase